MKARKKLMLALGGVAAALALTSIAFAAIPDGGGVIHGCFNKQSGQLRVTDTDTNQPAGCSSKESALTWNQQGPQGIAGPVGPAGPQGPAGPSDGWDGQVWGTVPAGGALAVLSGGVSVPPGSYLISGSVAWEKLASGSADLKCSLDPTNANASSRFGRGLASTAAGGSLALTGWMTVSDRLGSHLTVECDEESGTTDEYVTAEVQAIRVGALHTFP